MSNVPNATKEWHIYKYHIDTCRKCIKGPLCTEAGELFDKAETSQQ